MEKIDRHQLIDQLRWRYATKQFDPQRKISKEDWAALEEALVLTPTSFGLQPLKFIVITDQSLKEQLVPVTWGQRQVADCSHLVVFTVQRDLQERDVDKYIELISTVREIPVGALSGMRDMINNKIIKGLDNHTKIAWAARQAYIALGNLLTSAALIGIDACPMEGFQPEQYDEILALPEKGLTSVVLATLGYRHENDKYASLKKVRFAKENLIINL